LFLIASTGAALLILNLTQQKTKELQATKGY